MESLLKTQLHGINRFNQGMLKAPLHIQLWVLSLVSVNLVIPSILLYQQNGQDDDNDTADEAPKLVLASFFTSFVLMAFLTGTAGFSRIVGVGHAGWVPLLVKLWTLLLHHPAHDIYGIWLRAILVLDTVSVVLDTKDAIRFLSGDRDEIVKGLPPLPTKSQKTQN